MELNRIETHLMRQIIEMDFDESLAGLKQELVHKGVKRAVVKYRDENRNGAGVTRNAGRRTVLLLRRVRDAFIDATEHKAGEVRRESRKLVRSTQNETFEQLDARAKKLYTLKRNITHQSNERRQRERAWRERLDDGTELACVPTSDGLRSVGRSLNLCVASRSGEGKSYHDALRSGESGFYHCCPINLEN